MAHFDPDVLTLRECARQLGVPVARLSRAHQRGDFAIHRVGHAVLVNIHDARSAVERRPPQRRQQPA